MRKVAIPLASAVVAAMITSVVMSMATHPARSYAQARPVSSYAEDRAEIEDLQARYLFALDFHDPDLCVSTFTEDGVLDYGSGEVKGRQAIKNVIAGMPSPKPVAGKRAGAARHNISNIVIKVDGDKAEGRSHYSTGSDTMKTNSSRSTANGYLQNGRYTTKGVMSGRIKAPGIRLGDIGG